MPQRTEVLKSDLLRGAAGAGGRAVRQARRLLPRRPARGGDHRPPRPGREAGRPPRVRGPAPPAPQGLLPADRRALVLLVKWSPHEIRPRSAAANLRLAAPAMLANALHWLRSRARPCLVLARRATAVFPSETTSESGRARG